MAGGESKAERAKAMKKSMERWKKNDEAGRGRWGGGGDENGGGNFSNFGRSAARDLAGIIDAEKLADEWGPVWEERVRTYAAELTAAVVAPADIDVSFESLPYHLE